MTHTFVAAICSISRFPNADINSPMSERGGPHSAAAALINVFGSKLTCSCKSAALLQMNSPNDVNQVQHTYPNNSVAECYTAITDQDHTVHRAQPLWKCRTGSPFKPNAKVSSYSPMLIFHSSFRKKVNTASTIRVLRLQFQHSLAFPTLQATWMLTICTRTSEGSTTIEVLL